MEEYNFLNSSTNMRVDEIFYDGNLDQFRKNIIFF